MTPAVDEQVDLTALRQLDLDAFRHFVATYQHLVLGLGQTLGLGPADRDDLAAETFAVAYRMLPTFRGDSKLSTWVYKIAYRTALKVRQRYPRRGGGEMPEVEGPATPAGEDMETRETTEAIWSAVARLDPEQAAAIDMFYRRGLSVEQVAEAMAKPEGTIKTLLFRGRERLKTLLGPLARTSGRYDGKDHERSVG
ncbi:MAG TPA: sigma-70 family RNA polymerase sigma factor [Phycisphaerae bacterium]|nr:sigma-70 family RNA polymerase sigma factor [Phycisphaerae bacterium]